MSILLDKALTLTHELAAADVSYVGVFPKGHVSLLVGEPGVGKTWFTLAVAKAVVDGKRPLGCAAGNISKGRVLLFAGETGVRLLASRLELLGAPENIADLKVVSSHVMAQLSIDTMINTAIGRKNISDAIKEYQPDIVFFDTMISFMADGKDESSVVDINDCLRGLSNIAHETGAAIVVVHHFRKRLQGTTSGDRTMDDVIGSSALTRLASLVVGLERKGELKYVRCLKSWWQEFAPFAFRLKGVEGHVDILEDYNYESDGTYSPTKAIRKRAEVLISQLGTVEFTIADISAILDTSRTSAGDTVRFLLSQSKVEQTHKVGNTTYYRLKEVTRHD